MELQKVNGNSLFDGESYQVIFEPAKINFQGYQQMLDKVDQITNEYSNWEVKPEILKESKNLRAELNNLRKNINQRKIDISKQADTPIKEFKDKIKVLLDKIDATSSQIDKGIKEIEAKEKQDRHNQRFKIVEKLANAAGVNPEHIVYDPKWDLKSVSTEYIEREISKQIDVLIARENDFRDAIKVVELQANQLALPADHWIELLHQLALSDVLNQMADYKKEVSELAKKQAETKKKEAAEIKKQGKYIIDPSTGEIKERLKSFSMEFYEVNSYQMDQLAKFLRAMGIKVGNAKSLKR